MGEPAVFSLEQKAKAGEQGLTLQLMLKSNSDQIYVLSLTHAWKPLFIILFFSPQAYYQAYITDEEMKTPGGYLNCPYVSKWNLNPGQSDGSTFEGPGMYVPNL